MAAGFSLVAGCWPYYISVGIYSPPTAFTA